MIKAFVVTLLAGYTVANPVCEGSKALQATATCLDTNAVANQALKDMGICESVMGANFDRIAEVIKAGEKINKTGLNRFFSPNDGLEAAGMSMLLYMDDVANGEASVGVQFCSAIDTLLECAVKNGEGCGGGVEKFFKVRMQARFPGVDFDSLPVSHRPTAQKIMIAMSRIQCALCHGGQEKMKILLNSFVSEEKRQKMKAFNQERRFEIYRDCDSSLGEDVPAALLAKATENVCQLQPLMSCLGDTIHNEINPSTENVVNKMTDIMFHDVFGCSDVALPVTEDECPCIYKRDSINRADEC